MKKRFTLLAALSLVMIALAIQGTAQTFAGKELIERLQRGGYVLYFRHSLSASDQADTNTSNLDDTKSQRQLTDEGRALAKAMGAAFAAMKIPGGEVLTSKYYRAIETAMLFNLGEPRPTLDLTEGGQVVPPAENRRRAAALVALLSSPVLAGKNRILVAHRPNLQDAAGKEYGDLAEGEAAIFKPLAEDGYKLMARVTPEKWAEWAKALAK